MKQFVILSFFALFLSLQSVPVALADAVRGYAWGGGVESNPSGYEGMGWISMNSADCDMDGNTFPDIACGGNNTSGTIIPYAVNIPSGDGDLSGYAWSEHYGWISFNASDVPAFSSPYAEPVGNARREGDNILGWARIIGICDTGRVGDAFRGIPPIPPDGHCNADDTPWDPSLNPGGFHGWISFGDPSYGGSDYQVKVSRMKGYEAAIPTYAFSDELGWIDFSHVVFGEDYRICPENLTITEGETVGLHAYYKADGIVNCFNTATATDVTSLVTWSSSAPAKASVGANTGLVSGIANGSALVSTTPYLGKTASPVNVTVACVSNFTALCNAKKLNYCSKESISLTDRCGHKTGDPGYSCVGTKDCDYNWKEIAP